MGHCVLMEGRRQQESFARVLPHMLVCAVLGEWSVGIAEFGRCLVSVSREQIHMAVNKHGEGEECAKSAATPHQQ